MWSDNYSGEGSNLLGMALLLLRDELGAAGATTTTDDALTSSQNPLPEFPERLVHIYIKDPQLPLVVIALWLPRGTWTRYIYQDCQVDPEEGTSRSTTGRDRWQHAVRSACQD
eukprot:739226-Amphidinium_carterae.1